METVEKNQAVAEVPAEQPVERTTEELERIFEAALFAAGHPLRYDKLANVLGMMPGKVRKFAKAFAERYNAPEHNRGIELLVMEDQCQLCTKSDLSAYVKSALGMRRTAGGISGSCMEVLAIIAYQQPVTKSCIEELRNGDSTYQINTLLERRLIMRKGRLDVPGRPILYGTAPAFLRCFGLSSLADLPSLQLMGVTPETEQAAMLPDDVELDEYGDPIDEDALYDPAGVIPAEEAQSTQPASAEQPVQESFFDMPSAEEPGETVVVAEAESSSEWSAEAFEPTDVDDFSGGTDGNEG